MVERRRYTRRQKATAVAAALASSTEAAAETTGIPRKTIAYWLESPEFAELRQKTREDLAEAARTAAVMALDELRQKLPTMNGHDTAIAFGILVDKSQLLAGQATNRTEHRELLGDFDDHERDAVAKWLRDIAAAEVTADAGE